jgi:PAS domain S-box-containing protein
LTDKYKTLQIDADNILDSVHEIRLLLSADLSVQQANDAFYRTFKVTPAETVGRLIYDLGNQQWQIPELRKLLEDILPQSSEFLGFEVSHTFSQIGRKTVRINARQVFCGGKPTDLILLVIEDITERRRSRHFDVSHDLLVVSTLDGFFVDVNPSFQRVLGYSRDDLLSKPLADFIHSEDQEKTAVAIRQLGTGQGLEHFQNRYRSKSGDYRWFEWTCPAAVPGEIFLYAAARDITELVVIEEERQRIALELTRSNSELEQFAYVASHDLQEPLRAVAGCVQILQKRYQTKLDASADELIGHTVAGVNRMRTLINDLLTYARITRRGGEFVPTDLEVPFSDALLHLETSQTETGAVVTHDPLPTVLADRGQMVQLFQNLLGNALKFHGTEIPQIHLSVKRVKHDWRIGVSDNGIGIEKGYLERIFVLFQRLHTRTEYSGTGIGLALCKKIVERHGGHITVESKPGVGSTFIFTIPSKETL